MLDLETQAEAAFLWDSRRNRIEQDARETRPNQTGCPGRGAQTSRCAGRSSSCGWYHAHAARRSFAGRRLPRPGGRCDALPATAETMNDGSLTKAAFIREVAEVAGL